MGILLLVQIILIALNAVFASAEIAVLSVNEARLEQMARQGDKKAVRLYRLTREPARFLSTIQIAITLSGFLGSAFAADGFSDPLVDWVVSLGVSLPRQTLDTIAVVLITLILSYFTLIFGELVPKRIAMKKSEQLALAISGLIAAISAVFRPVVWLLSLSTNAVLRLCGIDPHEEEEQVSEEEIRMMVKAGGDRGTIDREEQAFIQNVFEFDDITAEEIATHRTDVTILWLEDDDETWAKTIHDSRHTLYPVCDGSPDNVTGVLNAKDYFRLSDRSRQSVLAGAVSPAYFVPECVRADVLFRNMKRTGEPMAVVLDEYGGFEGIVTMNDLLEQLVGELDGDGGEEAAPVQQVSPGIWRVRGDAPLAEVAAALDMPLPCDEFDTFNGLVLSALGSIPPDGAAAEVNTAGLEIREAEFRSHQVKTALVRPVPAAPQQEE